MAENKHQRFKQYAWPGAMPGATRDKIIAKDDLPQSGYLTQIKGTQKTPAK